MAMGQAAGAAAALAAERNTTPMKIPIKKLKEILINNNAIVPGE